ncbi:hypothetical protein AKO1_014372 [Acrasis kona]|uniref:Uncharacterized protein n=1 Tax=Acrasis kona TaxID=1008807 RepID=A0AAW2YZV3_9EUKA
MQYCTKYLRVPRRTMQYRSLFYYKKEPEDKRMEARNKFNLPSLGKFEPPLSDQITSKHLENKYHLVIGINTVARLDNQNNFEVYIKTAIKSLLRELQNFYKSNNNIAKKMMKEKRRILLFVQDNTNDKNPPFDEMEAIQDKLQGEMYDVVLFKNKQRFLDPFKDIKGHDYKAADNTLPGHRARQQNADVISFIKHAVHFINFDHFLFMEDDFVTCGDMPYEVLRVIDELAKQDENNCGFRVSYGMNGLVFPRRDLVNFIDYVSHHIDMFPIDLMIRRYLYDKDPLIGLNNEPISKYEPCRMAKRFHYTFKHVLQEHIGKTSTFEERNVFNFRPAFPGCGYPMSAVWNLNEDEIFSLLYCPNWSVSPCGHLSVKF